MLTDEGLPEYAALLAARHTAHETELKEMLKELFGECEGRVLDVACGDGFYSTAFDRILHRNATITAVDLSGAFLTWAANCVHDGSGVGQRLSFVTADAERLPFADETFDLVWCAQSLISLPHPSAALREMRRVTRRGGTIGLLENDRLHEMQLPFPPDLELALRQAERRVEDSSDSGNKPFAGRFLEDLLIEAGLQVKQRKTSAIDRQSPLSTADEAFVQAYLHTLLRRTAGLLDPVLWDRLKDFAAPDSRFYLPRQPGFWMTWTDVVVVSTRD